MHLHKVAVTSYYQRLFTVGTMVTSSDGLQSSKSRNENRSLVSAMSYGLLLFLIYLCIVHNLDKQRVET